MSQGRLKGRLALQMSDLRKGGVRIDEHAHRDFAQPRPKRIYSRNVEQKIRVAGELDDAVGGWTVPARAASIVIGPGIPQPQSLECRACETQSVARIAVDDAARWIVARL